MDYIFGDLIGDCMQVYIDDIMVKSASIDEHIQDLRRVFEKMRPHNLRMNPAKCAFGVKAGHFLGFLVHNKGIEVDANKAKAILEARPPTNKKELQRFIGQVGFLRRFLANAVVKMQPLTAVLRIKDKEGFVWGEQQEAAFRAVKEAFT